MITQPVQTDVIIVGAGPVGLFAVFELGLFDMRCHLIDSLDRPGGQCAALYPDKPIYDIPAWPSLTAQGLIDQLLLQIAPFNAIFSFDRLVSALEKRGDGGFRVTTDKGEVIDGKVVVFAMGNGAFVPRSAGAMVTGPDGDMEVPCTRMLPSFGRTTKLGPLDEWGFDLDGDSIPVDTEKFETSVPGIFAIGDVNAYPGKLKLILSGFHEAALMTQAAKRIVRPGRTTPFQYTTSSSSLRKKLGVL